MQTRHTSKTKFLDAALSLIRTKGYASTTVDDLCAEAGLTKGSFFHHFPSKEALGVAAAAHFAEMAEGLFATGAYRDLDDPLDRLLGYVDFRASLIQGDIPDFTCLLGTIVQESYQTHPALREACDRHIRGHAATVAEDIAEAKRLYAPDASWTPESLALFTQAALQGAFVLAKAGNDASVARDCVGHLRRYLESRFTR
jgi:TetR/AcrR family transcriptional regulator, transcriptional repressor for nem operon